MSANTIKYEADGSNYFDVVDRIKQEHSRLGDHVNRNEGGFGGLLKSEGRVSRNMRELFDDMAHAKSGGDLLSAGIFRIGESLRIGLGGAVAIGAIYEIGKSLSEAGDEAAKAREEIESISTSRGGGAFRSFSDMDDHLKSILEKLDKVGANARGGAIPSIGEHVDSLMHGENPYSERNRQYAELLKAAQEEAGNLVQKYQILAGITREMGEGSERNVEIDQAHADTLEKQNDIYAKLVQFPEQMGAALDAESSRYNAQLTLINHKHDLIESTLRLSEQLTTVNARVADGDITSNQGKMEALKAKVEEASKREFNAPEGSEEKKKAHIESVVASQELEAEEKRQFLEKRRDPRGVFNRELQEKRDTDLFNATKRDQEDTARRKAGQGLGNEPSANFLSLHHRDNSDDASYVSRQQRNAVSRAKAAIADRHHTETATNPSVAGHATVAAKVDSLTKEVSGMRSDIKSYWGGQE